MESIEKLIIETEEKQVDAFNQADVDKILGFFDPDIVCFSSTKHERLVGQDALRGTFEYYLKEAEKVEYSISEPSVQLYGDTAILTFYWLVTLINGAKRREIHGRGSHVYFKRDGEWKIVHEHFSRAHHAYEKK
jgi:ketosteroid isomerase-like protein